MNKKCSSCGAEISQETSKCPYCGKNQKNWFARHKLFSILCGMIIFANIVTNSAIRNFSKQQNDVPVVPQIQQKKLIPYEVKQISQSNGAVNFIIVDTKNMNINDLTVLGQELHADYINASLMRISIFDDIKAVQMRDRVISDQATQDEIAFYDNHYIAQYNKNSNTGYNQFTIYRDETGDIADKVINY